MRIVQFNTHHGGKRSDDKLDTAGLGRAIARLKPDAVCLNEVEQFDGYGNHDCAGMLAAALGPEWRAYSANQSGVVGGHGIGNAILARPADVGSVLGVKTLYDSRVAIGLRVRGAMVIAVHLDNVKEASRVVEVCQLLAWDGVRDVSPLAIAGDFNAGPTSLEMSPLRVFYLDAWLQGQRDGHAKAFNTTGNTKSTRIDAIYYRGLSLESVEVPDTRETPDGPFPSDHHPVVATFK